MRPIKTLSLCGLAVFGALSTLPALADDYTCEDDGPCIIQADDLGGFQVFLKWWDRARAMISLRSSSASMAAAIGRNTLSKVEMAVQAGLT